jgi:glycerophosphoryl diester phosphodiesterase
MDATDLPRLWVKALAAAVNARALRRGLTYDLLFKALSAAVLAAPAAWVLNHLIMLGGTRSITNEALVDFLLSAPGLAFVVLTLAFALAALYAELAGLIHIAVGTSRGAPPHWIEALAVSVAALPRLLSMALRQVVVLLAWVLPPVAIAVLIAVVLMGDHDINWYLTERPPELMAAALFGALLLATAAVTATRLALDWTLAIPLCLYERMPGRAALVRSRELAAGRRGRIFVLLGFTVGATALFSGALLWLADAAIEVLLTPIQGIRGLVIATALAVALLTFLAVVLS